MQMGKWVSRLLSLCSPGCRKEEEWAGVGSGKAGRLWKEVKVFSPSSQLWLQLYPGSGGLQAVLSVKAEGNAEDGICLQLAPTIRSSHISHVWLYPLEKPAGLFLHLEEHQSQLQDHHPLPTPSDYQVHHACPTSGFSLPVSPSKS